MKTFIPSFRRAWKTDRFGILFLLCSALSGTSSLAATITWSGAGGDELWSNPANWMGGALPASGDDVVINVPGATTVRMDAGEVTVRSLQCQESFVIESYYLTVTGGVSVVNGTFSLPANHHLTVQGAGTTFSVNGPATNLAGVLLATGGGVISLPTAREWISEGYNQNRLSASGVGSAINLTNVTNAAVPLGRYLQADVSDGGQIDLRSLRTTDGTVAFSAAGTNSLVNLSGLHGLWSGHPYHVFFNRLSASDGGAVLVSNVTALSGMALNLSDSGQIPTAQFRSFTDGGISFSRRTNGLQGLTNFSGSISAYDSRLDLTNITTLQPTNGNVSLSASQGSVIDLSRVTNVVSSNYALYAATRDGSRIDLRGLAAPEGLFYVDAQGTGSLVDLSGFNGPWHGTGRVKAWDGASVLIPNVTTLSNISLDLRADAVVPTAQLRSFTGGTLELTSRTNGFAGLTNFSGWITAFDTRLDLTNFTVLYATNDQLGFNAYRGSFIDLSRVTNLVTSPLGYGLYASASGSRIDLRRLRAPEGPVSVIADGADSLVDLSGFSGLWHGSGVVTAGNGGTVLMPFVTALNGVSLDVSGNANVNLAQLNSIAAGTITLRSRTNDLTGVTNFSGQLNAYDSRLYLTNLNILYVTNHVNITADQGSLIDMSRVTNLVMAGWTLYVNAYSGGRIDLSRLQAPRGGPFFVEARGPDSLVDLSAFSGLWDGNDSVSVRASSGATVVISNVTAMRFIALDLSGDANVPLAQLSSFTHGSIRLTVQTNVFTELTNFTGTLLGNQLSRSTFPKLTQLIATNDPINLTSGNDSVIDLSNVTNAVVVGSSLSVYAYNRSRIELPFLETIVAGNVSVQASGTESVVDLSGLTAFFSDNNAGRLSSDSGGTILLNPNAMLLAGVAIDFQSNPGGPLPPFLAPSQSLVLYGQPWRGYRIESRNPSQAGSPWSLYRRVPLTEAMQIVGSRPPINLVLRVQVFIADPPEVDIRLATPGTVETVLYGVSTRTYRLETTTSLGTDAWQDGPTRTMTNSFFIFPSVTTNDAQFYRARQM